eukprot:GHRQ01021216.1.p1 GENE.GHRQ01021216.1~~GHRQ01021216.1.p1  ORF type:complete len:245 (+),score=49.68 GHRQ01021216.1:185-919(+)
MTAGTGADGKSRAAVNSTAVGTAMCDGSSLRSSLQGNVVFKKANLVAATPPAGCLACCCPAATARSCPHILPSISSCCSLNAASANCSVTVTHRVNCIRYLPKDGHLLQLGVGTSRLQVDMADDGYNNITSIDYSPVAIKRLQQLYPGYQSQLSYAVADARSMPQYPDAGFSGVLDKGTLDALLCGDTEAADAAALMGEVWRLLQSGAAYIMVTSGEPRAQPAVSWSGSSGIDLYHPMCCSGGC